MTVKKKTVSKQKQNACKNVSDMFPSVPKEASKLCFSPPRTQAISFVSSGCCTLVAYTRGVACRLGPWSEEGRGRVCEFPFAFPKDPESHEEQNNISLNPASLVKSTKAKNSF